MIIQYVNEYNNYILEERNNMSMQSLCNLKKFKNIKNILYNCKNQKVFKIFSCALTKEFLRISQFLPWITTVMHEKSTPVARIPTCYWPYHAWEIQEDKCRNHVVSTRFHGNWNGCLNESQRALGSSDSCHLLTSINVSLYTVQVDNIIH